jgi:PadR family transcriptional regulator, regulatory protein AphA
MLSKTAYVILGMIRMGKRTGYEIKSLVDISTRHFWAASYGQIYPELKRLEEAGLVTGTEEPSGARQRRAFELTPAGEEALDEWLRSGGSLVTELRHEGLLRFFFSDWLPLEDQVELLHTMRAEHQRIRAEMVAIHPTADAMSDEHGRRAPLLTLEFGIAYQDFIIGWCDQLERRLTAEAPARAGS